MKSSEKAQVSKSDDKKPETNNNVKKIENSNNFSFKNALNDSKLKTQYKEFISKLQSPTRSNRSSLVNDIKDQSSSHEVTNIPTTVFVPDTKTSTSVDDCNGDSLESEPMDWEYTSDDISNLQFTQKEEKLENKSVDVPLETFETMEQYLSYKNLLNDEQEFDQKYFYVVVDTNIFLSNLEFIDKLIKIRFKSEFFT